MTLGQKVRELQVDISDEDIKALKRMCDAFLDARHELKIVFEIVPAPKRVLFTKRFKKPDGKIIKLNVVNRL